MNIPIITPAQSIEARENLSINQPIVIAGVRALNPAITFNKTYLSEFEGNRRNLTPVAQRALRDYYESQGHEFTDTPEKPIEPPQAGEHVRVVRDAMVVCDRLSHSQRGAIQDRIQELLEKIQSQEKAKAAAAFLFDVYDDETNLKRDKAIAIMAEIGLLYSILFRQCPIAAPSEALLKNPSSAKNIAEILSVRFYDAFKIIGTTINQDDNNSGKDDSTISEAIQKSNVNNPKREVKTFAEEIGI